tara:strand:- start:1555 stop:1830 length:276 start_codon:yes stop_codon:yes gene_type:complete
MVMKMKREENMINEIRNRLAILSEDPNKLKDLVDNLIETDPQTARDLKVLLNSKIDDDILNRPTKTWRELNTIETIKNKMLLEEDNDVSRR